MRIALYYPWIYLTSGAERTILELSGRSRHEWTLFTSHYDLEQTFPGFSDRRVVQLSPVSVKRSIKTTVMNAWRIFKQRLPLDHYDLLVVVCEGLGDLVVFRNHTCPIICICLTPLRVAFDPFYQSYYEKDRPLIHRFLIRAGSFLFRLVDRRAWSHYSRVFCISEECRRRALAGGLGHPDSQETLHVGLGFEPRVPSDRFDRFFLIPGRIMWTKNIELGVRAFQQFRSSRAEFEDFRLVVAGIVDAKSESYLEQLQRLADTDPGIEFRVCPTDPELSSLYRTCYGVLFTAFNEDWGIVPLESMAYGKPVIAVNQGGPRETVVHGETGFLEAADPGQFASRMAQFALDPQLANAMGKKGHLHARSFSWEPFCARIDREIDRLTSDRDPIYTKGQRDDSRPLIPTAGEGLRNVCDV